MTTMKKTTKKPARKARRKSMTIICPHCGEDFDVKENGRYICPKCENYVDVDLFPTEAVMQPDDDSCGWATTKWVLQYFDALDVSDKKLREELNTDARHGFRALLRKLGLGDTLITQKGTLPKAIFDALARRGITMKNPVRLENPMAYTDYLNETFDEGGCAIMLLANTSILHWMGIDRVSRSRFRLMDPASGGYFPFAKHIDTYRKQYGSTTSFLVFGFARK